MIFITKTCPCNIQRIFSAVKIESFNEKFNIVAQIIDCGYAAVLTSTHNPCFGSKIRKLGIPLHIPVFLYKSGVYMSIHFTDMFS